MPNRKHIKLSYLLSVILSFMFASVTLPVAAMQIYGHRGARGLAPENTLPAYRTALSIGVDYVDLDIGLTRDGIIVVTHDYALNPEITRNLQGKYLTKHNRLIHNLTLAECQIYDVGKINPETEYAHIFSAQIAQIDTHIPTLAAVIDYVQQVAGDKVKLQLEVKIDPTDLTLSAPPKVFARKLVKVLKHYHRLTTTEIQSFNWQVLQALQQINPMIRTAYLTSVKQDKKLPVNILPDRIAVLGGKIWGPQAIELNRSLVIRAHKLGLKVVPWFDIHTTNSDFDAIGVQKLLDYGVDGIITDRPDLLRALMARRGMHLPQKMLDSHYG